MLLLDPKSVFLSPSPPVLDPRLGITYCVLETKRNPLVKTRPTDTNCESSVSFSYVTVLRLRESPPKVLLRYVIHSGDLERF